MAERDSGWVSGGVVDAEDARLATGVLAAPGSGPIQSRSGIKVAAGSPGFVRPTPTPSGSVTVEPFQAVIQGTRTAAAGPYLVTLDAVKSINVLAVPPHPSNARRDLIVAVQSDAQYGDQRTGLEIRHVPGEASATPVDPAVSGDYLPLARVAVAANATSITAGNIADLRVFTAASGGIIPVANRASRPPAPHPGQAVYVRENDIAEVSDGTNWYPIVRGGVAIYGPADPGWPKLAPTSAATQLVINKVTVPATPYTRTLFVTGHAMITYTAHTGRYDLGIQVSGETGPAKAISVIQPAAGDAYNSAGVTTVMAQPANRALVLDLYLVRAGGAGAVNGGHALPYTSINVLAIPA
ncbi:hypothetical protein [Phytohabitans rumicis]|uniref:Uncharacterized protein n=1 Tax=Phytohabitans rumicis TaxID=1076125 RepID=A0A6V8LK91_9ACTN|nr:hypothetical protein [Phytohabitans rumicis]GFJ95970.1 hypothetical protein Prum_096120 [Phytohabitans rumicis]